MLQGAVVAITVAAISGVLGSVGVGGPASQTAAGVFLLVGAILVAAFLATTRSRR